MRFKEGHIYRRLSMLIMMTAREFDVAGQYAANAAISSNAASQEAILPDDTPIIFSASLSLYGLHLFLIGLISYYAIRKMISLRERAFRCYASAARCRKDFSRHAALINFPASSESPFFPHLVTKLANTKTPAA